VAKDKKAIKVSMTIERETKRTYRYAEDGDKGVINNLYISKRDLPAPIPKKIEVTIQPL
jgi:hypothetical protein